MCLLRRYLPVFCERPEVLLINLEKSVEHSKWVERKIRSCFDKLSSNGFYAFQLIFLGSIVEPAFRRYKTEVSWEEAKAAVRLEMNRSAWHPTLTAMAFGQYFKNSFPISGGALVSHGYSSLGSLNLAWTLFDFGRREAMVDAGAQRLSAANFAFNRKHQEIAYQAALAKVTAAQQTFEAARA
jgi:hypothetical protein